MSSVNNIQKRFALILIDPQNGFINDGSWSRMFPIGQSTPILEAFNRIVLFLRAYKPHTNLSICPGVHQWLHEQLEAKLDVVIGGCTITSCVRDSSIQMKKMFSQLNFYVDQNLCAARKDNYVQRCQKCFERYMIDGSSSIQECAICISKDLTEQIVSPVQLAYQQMKDAGVNVVTSSSESV
jgi:hypothetical protein